MIRTSNELRFELSKLLLSRDQRERQRIASDIQVAIMEGVEVRLHQDRAMVQIMLAQFTNEILARQPEITEEDMT